MRGTDRCVLGQPLFPWLEELLQHRFGTCTSSAFLSSYGVANQGVIGLWSYTIQPAVFSVRCHTANNRLQRRVARNCRNGTRVT